MKMDSLIDVIENPQHSTKKELRPPGSQPKTRPPKLQTKRNLSRRLFVAHPISLLSNQNKNSGLSKLYDETLNLSYFDQCFEQIAKIGEGSFGEVYKVRSKENGQYYAIKRTKEYYHGTFDRENKIDEVRKYESIPYHENIIELLNAWEQDDYVYLQMELGCTSLERYAEDNHHISEQNLWNIFLDILLALKHLHENNLIHLDVKLDNIIICDYGVCKLGDFGLLMNLKDDLRKANEGDAKYLACELMEGKFTKAADVFSLGISMLELASDLELPSDGVLWHNLRNGTFPEHIIKDIPRTLVNIIRRMMVRDYKKRPSVKSLLRHPFLKSLLKQRREAATKGLNLDGRLTPPVPKIVSPVMNSTPPYNGFSLNESFISVTTPPLQHSTPNIQLLFEKFESSISDSTNEEFETAVPLSLMDTAEFLSPFATPKVCKNSSLFSSAKKLNFLCDN